MSPLILIIPIAILCVGTLTLYLDARHRRIARQLAIALPSEIKTTEQVSVRLLQDTSRHVYLMRLLLNYDSNAPRYKLFIAIGIIVAIATAIGSSMLVPLWVAPLDGTLTGLVVMRNLFGRQRNRYTDRLMRQMPDTLEMVISAVRTGLPVTEAFRAVSREMPAPTQEQFIHVVNDTASGRTADDALFNVYHRTQVPEYAMFAVTLAVQGKAGGRLAETLQTLCDTIRERVAMAGRAKALAGEAKLSAQVLGCLPFVAGLVMAITRPGSLNLLFFDPRGRMMLAFGLTMLVLGILTMRRMIRKGTSV